MNRTCRMVRVVLESFHPVTAQSRDWLGMRFHDWVLVAMSLNLGVCIVAFLPGCRRVDALIPDGSGVTECTRIEVSTTVGGVIIDLPVKVGERLQKGSLVAKLDPREYELKRDEVRAELDQVQAALDLIRAGSRPEEIEESRQRLRAVQATATLATQDLRRVAEVYAKGAATKKQMDDAQAQSDIALAAVAGAEQELAKLVRGNRTNRIRMAEAQVAAVRARLALAHNTVSNCTVIAPAEGIATKKHHTEGELVSAGDSIVTLTCIDSLWVRALVPEARLVNIVTGVAARVRIEGQTTDVAGVVSTISAMTEYAPVGSGDVDTRPQPVRRVEVSLDNRGGGLKVGVFAEVFLR